MPAGPALGGEEGLSADTRKARRRGPVERLHRVAPAGRDPGPRPSPPEHVRRRRFGVQRRRPPTLCACPQDGRPRLPDGPQRAGAGAPGVASAAAWAGARPSSTRRHWAGSARARARARGTGGALGRGKCTKPAFRRGATGSGEGQNASGRSNALKGQRSCACFLLKSVNPKGGRCRPFFSCTF